MIHCMKVSFISLKYSLHLPTKKGGLLGLKYSIFMTQSKYERKGKNLLSYQLHDVFSQLEEITTNLGTMIDLFRQAIIEVTEVL